MKLILVFLALGAILFATNPSDKQFREFIKEDIEQKAGQESDIAGEVVKLLAGESSRIKGLEAKRQNFYVASFYCLRAGEQQEVRYLGLLSHFFKLD